MAISTPAGNELALADKIKNCIANADLHQALTLFLQIKTRTVLKEATQQSGRHNFLDQCIRDGTLTTQEITAERNKISKALLELADQIETDEMPVPKRRLTKELEDILALAETESRRNGEDETSTRYFFAALVKIKPAGLKQVLGEIASMGAIDNTITDEVADLPRIYSRTRKLSACLTDTSKQLKAVAGEDTLINPADFFVDVAKHGHGSSVRKLRSKGIDQEVIEQYVDKYNINVKRRRP